MGYNRFASRPRVRCMLTAGAAALVGAFSMSGTAGASSEPPRFTIESSVDCAGPAITFSYDDHVDGHVPQAVQEDFDEHGYIVWSADEVHQVNGDYFNQRTFPMAGQTLSVTEMYGYEVMITYDDGVQQADGVLIDLHAICGSEAPSTTAPDPGSTSATVPSGALPATGAGDTTWITGSIGGLLLTTGAALVAGARRSRPQ